MTRAEQDRGADWDACGPGQVCVTCADAGVPMRVIAIARDGLASCEDADGAREDVETALVAPVSPGHEVLVHAGVAIARLEEGR